MAWKLLQVSNGHKSLENFTLVADDLFVVLHQLKSYFQERFDARDKIGLETLSSVATEIWIDGAKLTVGWDNWSGLFIMAWDSNGDRIVSEIEGFINT